MNLNKILILTKKIKPYIISILSIILVVGIFYPLQELIGYQSVALILLATVSLLAIFFSLYPVLLAAILSAVTFHYIFIPKNFSFKMEKSEDFLLLIMYFIIVLVNGVLNSKFRHFQKIEFQKEEKINSLRLYNTLFNSISHELRTPISTIVAASDNLLNSEIKFSEEKKKNLCNEISIAAFRLNRLVDNLLNMQRIKSGIIKPKSDWCDITELINFSINRLKEDLKDHIINVDINENIPLVKLDFGLMEQAIYNILHNASLYTPKGTIINIESIYSEKSIKIIISDSGFGIPDNQIDDFFSSLYKSNFYKPGGLGLGLSISQGFIEAHHGHINVAKNEPHGLKFQISIPSESYYLYKESIFNDEN